jgi:hypothetical protein
LPLAIRNAAPERDSEFYKNILQLLVAGTKEMSVIKSLLTGDQHGHTLALEHNVASRIDGDVCWFGEDQRFSFVGEHCVGTGAPKHWQAAGNAHSHRSVEKQVMSVYGHNRILLRP